VAVVLIVGGGILANTTQTDGGKVRVVNVSYPTETGQIETGLLYIPSTATDKTPACGVVTIHGYINSYDTMDGFSIEMARRGCVVLAANQTGHGTSQPPAFADAFGGPASLAYLDSLGIVKHNDIGLIGHSMGGWASVLATATYPKDYRSIVLISSSVGTPVDEPIPPTATFPRNIMVVEALYSEFSDLMWGVPKGSDFDSSARLQTLFGTKSSITQGKVYGSIAQGTARELYVQGTTHPGLTFDPAAIGHAVSWMQQTLTGVSPMSSGNQIWIWDEVGTFLALIGVGLFLFAAAGYLLRLPYFATIARPVPENRSMRRGNWLFGAIIFLGLGPVTFYEFQNWGSVTLFPAGGIFPQTITSGIMTWAVADALIGLALFFVWHFTTRKDGRGGLHHYGLGESNGRISAQVIGRSALLGVTTIAATYIPVYFFSWAFSSDVRLWIFPIKTVDFEHMKIALDYTLPFLLYFVIISVIVFGQLRPRMKSLGTFMLATTTLFVLGFVLFIALEYSVLFATGELLTSSQPLLSIVSLQFIPVYIIIGTVLSYFFWKTGRIYAGAVAATVFVVAIVVASTATQGVPW